MSRLFELYQKEIVPQLQKSLGVSNPFAIPRLEKIVLNMGVGGAVQDSKEIVKARQEMALIAGQQPVVTKARASIASFKVREGMSLGVKVTLRKSRMYEFLDRLVNIALPRIKDFRGLNGRCFDGSGNYSFGIKEQIIFPEINYDHIDKIRGMDITIVTSASDDHQSMELLKAFSLPFVN